MVIKNNAKLTVSDLDFPRATVSTGRTFQLQNAATATSALGPVIRFNAADEAAAAGAAAGTGGAVGAGKVTRSFALPAVGRTLCPPQESASASATRGVCRACVAAGQMVWLGKLLATVTNIPCGFEIGGGMDAQPSTLLDAFPGLVTIAGKLVVKDTKVLTFLSFPKLETIQGTPRDPFNNTPIGG